MPTDVLPLTHAATTLGMTPEDLLREFTRSGDTLFVSREAVLRFFERRLEPVAPVAQPRGAKKAEAPLAQSEVSKKTTAPEGHGGGDCLPLYAIPEFDILSPILKNRVRHMASASCVRDLRPGGVRAHVFLKRADIPKLLSMIQKCSNSHANKANTEGLVEMCKLPGYDYARRGAVNRSMRVAGIKTVRRKASGGKRMSTWVSAEYASRISAHMLGTEFLNDSRPHFHPRKSV